MSLLRASLLGLMLLSAAGCGPKTDPSSVDEMTPEKQEEIRQLQEAYSKSGRFGPSGQSKPTQKQ